MLHSNSTLTALAALLLAAILPACDVFGNAETPSPPTELEASRQDRGVFLQWSSPEDFPSAKYRVYRSESEFSSTGEAQQISDGSIQGASYLDASVDTTGGTTYYYGVTAVNDDSESDLSNTAGRTIFPPPPDDP
jgi:fibronectin type 3 domain-containing protein